MSIWRGEQPENPIDQSVMIERVFVQSAAHPLVELSSFAEVEKTEHSSYQTNEDDAHCETRNPSRRRAGIRRSRQRDRELGSCCLGAVKNRAPEYWTRFSEWASASLVARAVRKVEYLAV